MKTSDFDYSLPQERIAQTPLEPRHASRLLVLKRDSPDLEHRTFWEIDAYLNSGDLLVINRTKVIPARIFGRKITGGRVEVLLLAKKGDRTWEALIGGKKMRPKQRIFFPNGLEATIVEEFEGSRRLVDFTQPVESIMLQMGEMPLPPYIHTRLDDPERYQTVYAQTEGSAAAPTAGLHFTRELMDKIKEKGIRFAEVTLHVGLDTFAPVHEEEPQQHQIHSEWCELDHSAVQIINDTRRAGGRIIAVGTTSVRALESAAQIAPPGETVAEFFGATRLFILPGYHFKAVDALITNFHLPKSTLIMLVSAFAGRERILSTYQEAIAMKYRFYSFGDAMLIL